MERIACVLALVVSLLAAHPARAADLPPGAIVRLGESRFRTGDAVGRLAVSPDGKQYATVRLCENDVSLLTVWDVATGQPLREQEVNTELLQGIAWGKSGAFAVVIRAETGAKGKPATLYPADFRVWDYTDAQAAIPPVLPVGVPNFGESGAVHRTDRIQAIRHGVGAEYADFTFAPGSRYVAARWKSPDGKKQAVHVYEVKPAPGVANLRRVGVIELGAEGADDLRLSADGATLVVFRKARPRGWTATAWQVATGKPEQPVVMPAVDSFTLTPDAHALVMLVPGKDEWGFDLFTLATGERKPLTRWRSAQQERKDGSSQGGGRFAFSPSGRELAVAVGANTHVIDIAKGKELARLEGHAGEITAVAWSAGETIIATADIHGLVRLWDANTLRPLDDLAGHRAPVSHAELSPDGRRLLSWAEDATARLWDITTGKELRAFADAHTRPTFTPGGTAILYGTKERLLARDLQTGLETPLPGTLARLGPRFAVFAPDGKAVMTWGTDGSRVEVWDWPRGKRRFTLDTQAPSPADAGFSPDGIAIFLDAREPTRWDSQTGKELPPAWRDDRVNHIHSLRALHPNPRLLLHEPYDRLPRVIEAGSGTRVARFRLESDGNDHRFDGSRGIALAPRGGSFAVVRVMEPGRVFLCEAATGQIRRVLTGHRGSVRVLGFTPDGAKLLTAGGDHSVFVWDVRLQGTPLPEAIKKETNAAKLWAMLATGGAKDAYLAMARMARDPDAAVKMAALKLRPAATPDPSSTASRLADGRAIELLEAIASVESRELLKELAKGHAGAFRTQEAKRVLERKQK